jgi:hypothetical protein
MHLPSLRPLTPQSCSLTPSQGSLIPFQILNLISVRMVYESGLEESFESQPNQ